MNYFQDLADDNPGLSYSPLLRVAQLTLQYTPDFWRDGHDRRRLIGILMLVFKNHPNRAGADLGRKPVCSVTFIHRLHPYLLWSLRQTGGGSDILEPAQRH
jgi:hypothetical protein